METVSNRQIKSDEMFSQGLDKLSPDLRKSVLLRILKVRKNDIKKLSKLKIPDGSIDNLEALSSLIN